METITVREYGEEVKEMSGEKIAIIGGTGVYNQSLLKNPREFVVETVYGKALMQEGNYKGRNVYFLARHGPAHGVPPHRINYRANIAALRQLGVSAVIATAAVGTVRKEIVPGSQVVIDQFIDYTRGRDLTFFDETGNGVVHVDFTEPYCPAVRRFILRAGGKVGQSLIDGGCYVCTEGPRFETPAEIKMIARWGGDLVGMTNVPEVILAREAGLCYAAICQVTNYAAGISPTPLTHEEVLDMIDRGKEELDHLIAACIEEISDRDCRCRENAAYWE